VRAVSQRWVVTNCILAASFVSYLPSALADVSDCTDQRTDWIRLSITATENKDWEKRLREHLNAELARHHIAACDDIPGSSKVPLAIVRVDQSETHRVGIEVRVEDQVTNKIVTRQLDLSRMPRDSHAMTVALGVSELLLASWAELNLFPLRERVSSVPTSVQHALNEEKKRPVAALGLALAGEEFSGGLRQAGLNVQFEFAMMEGLHLGLRLGGRESLGVTAPDGKVSARTWLAGIAPSLRVTPADALASVSLAAHFDAAQVQFSAEPHSGASSTSGSGTALVAGLGVRASLKFSAAVEFALEAEGGHVMNGVRARDAEQEVVAMSGAWVGANTGVNVWF